MKKIIPVILLIVFIFTGCAVNKSIKIHFEKDEENTANYTVNTQIVTFENTGNSELEKDINTKWENCILEWIDDFKNRQSNTIIDAENKPSINITEEIKYNNGGVVSAVCEKSVYLNGAHGNKWWIARNYDFNKGCSIELSDLFNDDRYESIINKKLLEIVQENPDKYSDLWEQPKLSEKHQKDFYLDEKNLVIFFQPYDLSYYAKGVVEFPIRLEELRGYLTIFQN